MYYYYLIIECKVTLFCNSLIKYLNFISKKKFCNIILAIQKYFLFTEKKNFKNCVKLNFIKMIKKSIIKK